MTTDESIGNVEENDVNERGKTIDELARMQLSDMTEDELTRWTGYQAQVQAERLVIEQSKQLLEQRQAQYLEQAETAANNMKECFEAARAAHAAFSSPALL